ncbi:MAG: PAS domain-containing protein [Eubacteriales bacterium]
MLSWVLNLTKNKFTYISPSILQLRGITVEEALQESLEESLTPHSFLIAAAHLEKGVRELTGNPDNLNSYVNEIQQPCKNGKIIWTEVSTKFRYNADGEIEVVGVSRNIENRKPAEAEDNMYKNKLNESSSMRSKTISIIMTTLYEKYNLEKQHYKRVGDLCAALAGKRNQALFRDTV